MPRLTDHQRSEALGLLRAGRGVVAVARYCQCHKTTIVRLRHRFRQTGSVKDRPRPGQPRVTTPRQDGNVRGLHRRYPFRTSSMTARRTIGTRG